MIAGIIAEYNPFHNGHMYHIEQTKKLYGAEYIAVALGGNFTQRGDAAYMTKQARTRAALAYGADIVVEIPAAFSVGAAESFAYGGVSVLDALGCDTLSFGSECGDISLLAETAGAVIYASESDAFFGKLRRGISYPAALMRVVRDLYTDDVAEVLSGANNTLAIEYIKAIDRISSSMKPVTIPRGGAPHDGGCVVDGYISAMELRRRMRDGEDVSDYRPAYEAGVTADISRLETAILVRLRQLSAAEIRSAPNVTAGLENRIKNAAHAGRTMDEVYRLAKTKTYTMSRIRRGILSAFLGITKKDTERRPQYVRVLGMNERGRAVLSGKTFKLPVDTSLSALAKTSEAAAAQARLESAVGDVYAAALSEPAVCGLEFTAKPVII